MTAAPARPFLVPIDEVASMLGRRVRSLAPELLKNGKIVNGEWRVGSLSDDPGQSLCVWMSGPKQGEWYDFAGGDGGDTLHLVAAVKFGGNIGTALKWARSYLGLDDADPDRLAEVRREATRAAKRRDVEAEAEAAQLRASAKAMWLAGSPIPGTPVEAYLATRGITLAALGHVPAALRFHPKLWCKEAGAEMPGMVAAIADHTGQHISTHRTFLAERNGVWRKAKLDSAKLALGGYAGGFIKLTRGASGRAWSDVRGDETVVIAEGIETALSVAVLVPEWRAVAAVSVGNMASIKLNANIRDIIIARDNDAENSPADKAIEKAVNHFTNTGATVRVARPPAGVNDWNDQLRDELAVVAE